MRAAERCRTRSGRRTLRACEPFVTPRRCSRMRAVVDTLPPIAAELGLVAESAPASTTPTRAALGIPDEVGEARLVRGRGALRALIVVHAVARSSLRALFTQLASALGSRSGLGALGAASARPRGARSASPAGAQSGRAPRSSRSSRGAIRSLRATPRRSRALAASAGDDDLLIAHALVRAARPRSAVAPLLPHAGAARRRRSRARCRDVPTEDRRELALLAASRLLFLSFLEAKGWLDGDRAFLARQFDACMARGGGFHERVLLPLWFGTLNTPIRRRARAARAFGAIPFLNGGLFGKTALERRHTRARLSDESLGRFLGEVLGAYRFTAREEHERWSEAAIDPEMLGRAFESLMASRERRTSGAFYTPQALVAHVAEAALASRLGEGGLPDARRRGGAARRHARTRPMRPRCGTRARVARGARSCVRLGSVPRAPARAHRRPAPHGGRRATARRDPPRRARPGRSTEST